MQAYATIDGMKHVVAFGHPVYDKITAPSVSTDRSILSGCSTNNCLCLLHLGYQTTLVGQVGGDYYHQFTKELRSYPITLHVEQTEQTSGYHLAYKPDGNRTLTLLGYAGPIYHIPDDCTTAHAIILGPIFQEISFSLIQRIASQTTAPLFLDPQGLLRQLDKTNDVRHFFNPDILDIAPLCTLIKVNEIEARVLTDIDPRTDPHHAVQQLHTLGSRIAIITLAEAGSIITDGTNTYTIPAYPTEAYDPTGAGDSYLAGFVHAYLDTPDDLITAGCTGAATASLWIEHSGPYTPISPAEVARRTTELKKRCC